MQLRTIISVALALMFGQLMVMGESRAASPNLSGVYLMNFTSLCQATQAETTGSTGGTDSDATFGLSSVKTGTLSQTVGTMTFTPSTTGGQSGSISAALTQTKGSLLITTINGASGGAAMALSSATQTGTYSLNSTKLTLTFTGKTAQTFSSYYGQLGTTGTAAAAQFINLDATDATCSNMGILQHQ